MVPAPICYLLRSRISNTQPLQSSGDPRFVRFTAVLPSGRGRTARCFWSLEVQNSGAVPGQADLLGRAGPLGKLEPNCIRSISGQFGLLRRSRNPAEQPDFQALPKLRARGYGVIRLPLEFHGGQL